MLFKKLVEYSGRLRKASSRNKKIGIIGDFLCKLQTNEANIGVNFISGKIRQGKLNLAWKGLSQLMNTAIISSKPVDLLEIDKYLGQIKMVKGQQKLKVLKLLFEQLTSAEKKYLVALVLGEVQQGAGEGLVKMAIAKFFKLKDNEIEQAYLLKPDLGQLFVHLLKRGKVGIKDLGIKIFSPVRPMLAEISESISDVFDEYKNFSIEHKLDGIRIQVHKQDDKVRIFSRNLKDITLHFPELVEIAKSFPTKVFIIDGEAVGIDKNGRPVSFQILARRITRKKDIDKMRKRIPVVPKFFDIIYIDEDDLTYKKYIERSRILNKIIRNKNYLAERKLPKNIGDATRFFNSSLEQGNEGIMLKIMDAPYRPGKRGKFWFKIKKTYRVDCVILAAEWGHGRRNGWLSNLHLGVLDETKKKFLMVGKTFKGLTDKMLQWFTENLPQYKVHEDRWTLYVRPVLVVEIAFNEVQKSPKYDSGFALRFARIKRIRWDKKPNEINTILDLEKMKNRV